MPVSLEFFGQYLIVLLLSSIRVGAAFVVAPFFSDQIVPGTIRNLMIINMTLIIVPVTQATFPAAGEFTGALFFLILGKEAIIGYLLGFLVGMIFFAMEGVGDLIDTQRGSSMSQLMDPMSGNMTSPFGSLLIKAAVTLFFLSGGFLTFMGFFYYTYTIWPLFSFFPDFSNPIFPTFAIEMLDKLMALIVLIAAPVSIVMFLSEFGLGMMNKFAPQLNVFSLSMPIKSGVAAFIIVIYMGTIFTLIKMNFLESQKILKTFEKIISMSS